MVHPEDKLNPLGVAMLGAGMPPSGKLVIASSIMAPPKGPTFQFGEYILSIAIPPTARLVCSYSGPVDRHQRHQSHQAPDSLTVDQVTLGSQPRCHPARTVVGPGEILPIDQRHDRAILLADISRFAVDRGARYRQQPLLRYRDGHCGDCNFFGRSSLRAASAFPQSLKSISTACEGMATRCHSSRCA
jgi:hypothetical protein